MSKLRMKKIKTVRNLKGEVYRIIREGITGRKLMPGTQLKETALVETLGVSRTPIREALNQLSKEGIVEIYPRQGAFVKHWTKEEVIEILILREVLEGLAARLATGRLTGESIRKLESLAECSPSTEYARKDEQFHSQIIQNCGSNRLIDLINNLKDTLHMMDMRTVSFESPARIRESRAEHRRILQAFKSGDGDLAEKFTRENFKHTLAYYESQLQKLNVQEA